MSLKSSMQEDDMVVQQDAVKVVMDSQRAPLLVGTEVDDVDHTQGSGVVMKNPTAKTTCGRGSFFSA